MQTIFLATDEAGWCGMYFGGNAPKLDGHCFRSQGGNAPKLDGRCFRSQGGDYAQWPCPNKPPPGECREYYLVPVDKSDVGELRAAKARIEQLEIKLQNAETYGKSMADDNRGLRERIDELEKQLADRSPGVMPECVAKAIKRLENPKASYPADQICADELKAYFATPGHEWQPVDAEHPITAEDAGRKVFQKSGGVMDCEQWCVNSGTMRIGGLLVSPCGRYFRNQTCQHDITHILRPIAPPFVFAGEPGRYRLSSGEDVDVINAGFAGLIVLLSSGEWKCVNPDGTFAGGRITGRV